MYWQVRNLADVVSGQHSGGPVYFTVLALGVFGTFAVAIYLMREVQSPAPRRHGGQAYGVRVCVVRGDVAGIEYPHGCGTGIPHECMAMGVSGTHEGVHWNADMPFAAASVCASVPWWCRLSSHWVLGRMRAPGLRSQLVLQQLL